MSDVAKVREILGNIDRLSEKVRKAKVTLRQMKEDRSTIAVHNLSQKSEVPEDLRDAIVEGVETQIQLWENEIGKLEQRVVAR